MLVISLLLIGACKYEEGPAVSLRSKRNRLENSWYLVDCQVNGVSNNRFVNSNISGDSLRIILNINAGGTYCLEYEYTDKGKTLSSGQRSHIVHLFENSLMTKKFYGSGVWSFVNRHKSIEMGQFDLSVNEIKKTKNYKIVKLANRELKLSIQENDSNYLYVFQAI